MAELYAFIMAMTHSFGDSQGCFTFYTDCKWVIDSYQSGWSACTASSYVASALWRKLFNLVYDRFGDCSKVRLVKVKAHTSVASCAGDPNMVWMRGGNAYCGQRSQARGSPASWR